MEIEFKNWIEINNEQEAYSFLRLNIQPKDESNGLFTIDIILRGKCRSNKEVSKEELQAFAQVQSIALLWPYMRQHVSNTIASMNLPPFILPTLDVAKTFETLESNGGVN